MDKSPIRTLVPDDWTLRLARAIAAAVSEFAVLLGDEAIALLAVDCHPWHGTLGLSALTSAESNADSLLADPAEIAAWRYSDFARNTAAWLLTATLGSEMRAAYASGNCPVVADAFLAACATAVASECVMDTLEMLVQANGFRVRVTHPDNGRELVTSEGTAHVAHGGMGHTYCHCADCVASRGLATTGFSG